jgi:hypothetical protein
LTTVKIATVEAPATTASVPENPTISQK